MVIYYPRQKVKRFSVYCKCGRLVTKHKEFGYLVICKCGKVNEG